MQHRWAESRASKRNNGVSDLISAELYPPGHPYHRDLFPDPSALQALPVGELRAFVQAHYGPDRAILTLVGDFDTGHARELVEKYFGSLRSTAAVATAPAVPTPRPAVPISQTPSWLPGEIRLQVAAPVDFPSVTIAWPTVPVYDLGDADLDLIAEMLVGKRVGLLHVRLIDELKIASTVRAHQYSRKLGSEFSISATATSGHTAAELVEAIDELLRGLQSKVPSGLIVAGATTGFLFDKLLAFEHDGVRADYYDRCEELGIESGCFSFHVSRYLSLDGERLSRVAGWALPIRRRVVVEVTPAADAPATGRVLGRSVVPE